MSGEDAEMRWCDTLWGKSDAGGSSHLLVGHLLDTAAVAEVMWAAFLAPVFRNRLDDVTDGRGQDLFALICGLHDIGKASPAFQCKSDELGARVREAGLSWPAFTEGQARQWHHSLAGARILNDEIAKLGPYRRSRGWLWPLIAGHHGRVPSLGKVDGDHPGAVHGQGDWPRAQHEVVKFVTRSLGVDLDLLASARTPTRAVQLATLGALIMADWIASNDKVFRGIPTIEGISMAVARERAASAWRELGLRGGWTAKQLASLDDQELIQKRFGREPRPSQTMTIDAARLMPGPGLMIVEAPMGEGKTEAALAAVEVLAARFEADGVFFGMPTQATCDPMFVRLRQWRASIDPMLPVGLLHGKRRFNPEWRRLESAVTFDGIDDVDEDGMSDESADNQGRRVSELPSAWLLAAKRGLLVALTVATMDQLLFAATRTKHVMLRHIGLLGKVVVLDEVHAYDVYMSQFLHEALRWLGDAGVPVVLLSATLPPNQRRALCEAYLQGAKQQIDVPLTLLPSEAGYPGVTTAAWRDGQPHFSTAASSSWRESLPVMVQLVNESHDFGPTGVVDALVQQVGSGGCALVVCNTVTRAQSLYRALKDHFGEDVELLHARLTATTRADRTESLLKRLGAPSEPRDAANQAEARPLRLVLVATQVAEQSFDIDADVVVTDLAPIDLMLQRAGRLHRHTRSGRPANLSTPRLLVTGLRFDGDGLAAWPRASGTIYGDLPLLRAAALVSSAVESSGWSVPAQVPSLVASGYSDDRILPDGWQQAEAVARTKWVEKEQRRATNARAFLLSGPTQLRAGATLNGLHDGDVAATDEDRADAVVRDGDPSVEVIIVRRDDKGHYLTLSGRPLGMLGEMVNHADILDEVIGSSVRLPPKAQVTSAALELRALPAWISQRDSWLARARVLALDENGRAELGGGTVEYDGEVGLTWLRST